MRDRFYFGGVGMHFFVRDFETKELHMFKAQLKLVCTCFNIGCLTCMQDSIKLTGGFVVVIPTAAHIIYKAAGLTTETCKEEEFVCALLEMGWAIADSERTTCSFKKALWYSKGGFRDGIGVEGNLPEPRFKVKLTENGELPDGVEDVFRVWLRERVTNRLGIKPTVVDHNTFLSDRGLGTR